MSEDTEVVTLTGWLLEQIAEDEARLTTPGDGRHSAHAWDAVGTFSPRCQTCLEALYGSRQKGMAECAAKRRVVEIAGRRSARTPAPTPWDDILYALASVYADRPGFREEWRA